MHFVYVHTQKSMFVQQINGLGDFISLNFVGMGMIVYLLQNYTYKKISGEATALQPHLFCHLSTITYDHHYIMIHTPFLYVYKAYVTV